MYRTLGIIMSLVALAACGDGRGSQYSSARASAPPVSYVPVTPDAVPVTPVAGAAVPAVAAPEASGQVLSAPVAVTPGAVPIEVAAAPANIPVASAPLPGSASSLRPRARVTQVAAAPVAAVPPVTRTAAAAPRSAPTPTARTRVSRSNRGPIFSACRQSGRKQATQARCACVQGVANASLTKAQQSRGAKYFRNQQGLQDARQSDRASDEAFWKAWKAFGERAGRECRRS